MVYLQFPAEAVGASPSDRSLHAKGLAFMIQVEKLYWLCESWSNFWPDAKILNPKPK